MNAIGVPLSSPNWWKNCVDQDGNPVHILTMKDLEEMIPKEIIDRLAAELGKRLNETITKIGRNML
jgi:hypothetical protein